MPKLTDTYARAYACCDELLTELGRFPTIDLIRERISVNSPATIKKAMNDWTQQFAERHAEQLHQPELPVVLVQSVAQVWKLAVREAEQAYIAKERAYQQTLAEGQTALADQQQANQALIQMLEDVRAQLQQKAVDFEALQQLLEQQEQANRQLHEQVAASEKQLAEQAALIQEQAQRRQQQQDQDQAWFARRLTEEKQFMAQQWQATVQQQAQQIAALHESEAGLRQVCASLRLEQQRLQQAVATAQAPPVEKQHRFQVKSKAGKARRG